MKKKKSEFQCLFWIVLELNTIPFFFQSCLPFMPFPSSISFSLFLCVEQSLHGQWMRCHIRFNDPISIKYRNGLASLLLLTFCILKTIVTLDQFESNRMVFLSSYSDSFSFTFSLGHDEYSVPATAWAFIRKNMKGKQKTCFQRKRE